MRTLLNVLWLAFSGLWLAIGYVLAGVVLCLLIITIPFGVACFRLAAFVLWPFGRAVARNQSTLATVEGAPGPRCRAVPHHHRHPPRPREFQARRRGHRPVGQSDRAEQ